MVLLVAKKRMILHAKNINLFKSILKNQAGEL